MTDTPPLASNEIAILEDRAARDALFREWSANHGDETYERWLERKVLALRGLADQFTASDEHGGLRDGHTMKQYTDELQRSAHEPRADVAKVIERCRFVAKFDSTRPDAQDTLLEAAEALERAAQPPGRDEVAWVIEFTAFPEPLYFSGVDGNTVGLFDKDHLKAVRFARKEDGETILRVLQLARRVDYTDEDQRSFPRILGLARDCYAVTEHMWCSVPTKGGE